MTTGRINQVATVGLRPHAGRGASNDQRSPHRAELASHSHDDTTVVFHRSLTQAAGRWAEAAGDLDADARFSRLRGTRCGAGILKTVRLVSNLDVWHTVRIST